MCFCLYFVAQTDASLPQTKTFVVCVWKSTKYHYWRFHREIVFVKTQFPSSYVPVHLFYCACNLWTKLLPDTVASCNLIGRWALKTIANYYRKCKFGLKESTELRVGFDLWHLEKGNPVIDRWYCRLCLMFRSLGQMNPGGLSRANPTWIRFFSLLCVDSHAATAASSRRLITNAL